MGAVLEFRRDPNRVSKKTRRDIHEEECEWGVVIIFPGIRIERDIDPVEDYLVDECEPDDEAASDTEEWPADCC